MEFQSRPILLKDLGWYEVKLEKDIVDFLWRMIEDPNKKSLKDDLAGNISKSYMIPDEGDYFYKNVLSYLVAKWENEKGFSDLQIPINERFQFYLKSLWVNYQYQHEFNPIHEHPAAVFSFALWLKIPYSYEEQIKLPFLEGIKKEEKRPGCFQFEYLSMYGKAREHVYRLSPKYEGQMVFFPAQLRHTVYPFYNTKEPRISLSGNICCKSGEEIPHMSVGVV
tara:strand:+ start:147 stop:815 length:669 start_codon:yes stop_codon:yes gene_type:complete